MLVKIWTRNDETGLYDDEFRDGDVDSVYDDSFELSLGTQDKKSWLIIKIPNPPNQSKFQNEITRPEYGVPDAFGAENIIRRKRIYRLEWRQKFTADEIAIIEDATQNLPDGPDVVSGVVYNKFTWTDFARK